MNRRNYGDSLVNQLANRSNYYPRTLRHLAKLLNLLRRDNAQSWEVQKTSDRKENLLNELLAEKFGIFKGIVSDMFIDHFLSKNFNNLFNKNIDDIERKILDKVKEYKNIFPKDFERTFNWLNDRNVMANYKDIDFLERAFQGLAKNIRRGEILNLAVSELKKNYNLFEEKSIKEFFYVKNESIKEFSKKIF